MSSVKPQARQDVHSSRDEPYQHQLVIFSNSSRASMTCMLSLFRLPLCNYSVDHISSFANLTSSLCVCVHCHWWDFLSARNVPFHSTQLKVMIAVCTIEVLLILLSGLIKPESYQRHGVHQIRRAERSRCSSACWEYTSGVFFKSQIILCNITMSLGGKHETDVELWLNREEATEGHIIKCEMSAF